MCKISSAYEDDWRWSSRKDVLRKNHFLMWRTYFHTKTTSGGSNIYCCNLVENHLCLFPLLFIRLHQLPEALSVLPWHVAVQHVTQPKACDSEVRLACTLLKPMKKCKKAGASTMNHDRAGFTIVQVDKENETAQRVPAHPFLQVVQRRN